MRFLSNADSRTAARSGVFVCLVCLAFGLTSEGGASDWERGSAFIELFDPDDYGPAHHQNWDLLQDERGVLYVGNNQAVLRFDGSNWTRIPTPNGWVALALDLDDRNRLLLGAVKSFGYYEPDATGRLRYNPLEGLLPEDAPEYESVMQVAARSGEAFFNASAFLARWRGGDDLDIWRPETRFDAIEVIDGQLFVAQHQMGLQWLVGDRLEAYGSSATSESAESGFSGPIRSLLQHDGGILIVTKDEGLFLHDGDRSRPFPTAIDPLLRTADVESGLRLSDGRLALATASSGLLILDTQGKVDRHLDFDGKLVRRLFEDDQGGLWATLSGGLARIELRQPISMHGPEAGLPGTVWAVVRHRGRIYAGTETGVYRLDPREDALGGQFVRMSTAHTWCFLTTEHGLLAGTQSGIDSIEPAGETIATEHPVRSLLRSRIDPSRAYAGLLGGLLVLEHSDGRWRQRHRVNGVHEVAATLVEEPDGTLWVGTGFEGVLRIRPGPDGNEVERTDRLGEQHGLPPIDSTYALTFWAGGDLLVGTRQGAFRFSSEDGDRFVPDPAISSALVDVGRELFWVAEDRRGDLWARSGSTVVLRLQQDGSFQTDQRALGRLPRGGVFGFLPEDDDTVWIASRNGLARYRPQPSLSSERGPRALVSAVRVLGKEEPLYAGGALGPPASIEELPPEHNALRFTYGLPSFDNLEATVFQVRLEGFDSDWSDWTSETRKDYTNLPGGDYVFHVRGRDTYGRISEPGTYAFSLRPPWYRTGGAFGLYALLAVTALMASAFSAAHWRSRQLRARSRELERSVRERTVEVNQQKERIAEQARTLATQADDLIRLDAAKSRFFANVSHEFRTPLTLTIGPLHDLLAGQHGQLRRDAQEQIAVALRSSQRLLSLVDQLLDTARLESGRLRLERRTSDFGVFVRQRAELFRSLGESRKVELRIHVPSRPLPLAFDRDQMEKVLFNLLSNAFKFTESGDEISVEVDPSPADRMLLTVRDTGRGIPAHLHERVFERFYQVEESTTRGHSGAGIGLALVKELVELHGGEIELSSEVGLGTSFTVSLPAETDAPERADGGYETDWIGGPPAGPTLEPSSKPTLRRSLSGMSADDITTVLVVDDQDELRRFVRRHLEASFRVIEAVDGVDGLEVARRVVPDLIVSDVMMPRLDGYGLCEAVKSDPELDSIPVVLLTARAGSREVVEGIGHGADDYIVKPFDPLELEARVSGIISSRRHLKQRFGASDGLEIHARDIEITSDDESFLSRLSRVLEENLGDEQFTVERLARAMAMERSALYRRVRALLDEAPNEVLRRFRLERAAQLFDGGVGSVTEVAYSVGFASLSYFTKCFRERFGMTPSAYSKRPRS